MLYFYPNKPTDADDKWYNIVNLVLKSYFGDCLSSKYVKIIEEINVIRSKLNPKDFLHNIENLISRVEDTQFLKEKICTKSLLCDLKSVKTSEIQLINTKSYINSNDANFIVSLFRAPYYPEMIFEGFKFRLPVIDTNLEAFSTNVMPVIIELCSDGMIPIDTVAMFPEGHIDGSQEPGEKIFYFVNKFAQRHVNVTQNIIKHCVDDSSFTLIRNLNDKLIEEAVVFWVWFHEHHHQKTGGLRIPQYLTVKSNKYIAGLEELRVDVGGMLSCIKNKHLFGEKANYIFEFILAERILRYGVDGIKYNINGQLTSSYDAIGSFLGLNMLLKNGGVFINDNKKICVSNNIIFALEDIQNTIHNFEYSINHLPDNVIKQKLLEFIAHHLETDNLLGYYSNQHFDLIRRQIHHKIESGRAA